ncbi:PAS domain S-box protein [Rhodopirellula sallentina]|uniref:Signal transduction histidine kinase with CheB and CheR activity n=1 Tax=Rhodopirellula sallentina SM41 TaxID=1263870 RepID=M5U3R2_9BACT|nr:PAS domain S-box protein [Rhodopirellula sallentina]EMI55904.1 signal transduction histidine kinase with CheB and CheR activity [Rhodopirellula sallentina SM41]
MADSSTIDASITAPETEGGNDQTPVKIPIVGIGASAGGLNALETLFEQLPATTGGAFVVVQHLSPAYQSHMSELLGRRTKMNTCQVAERTIPEPNTVYLLPPGKHVVLQNGMLRLQEREDDGELNLPIDKFFHSLAAEDKRRIAAVVLSGTGSDGSEGIVSVGKAGGLVISQDEDSAQFNSMPLNAIRTGSVHVVAPVPELADSLVQYLGGAAVDSVVAQTAPSIERNDLAPVYKQLEKACGIDFGQYKHGTFTRRLSRRMMLSKIDQLDQYVDYLEREPAELSRLADDLMIGVTRFFRDPDGYHRLANRCIRTAASSKAEGDEFRAWIAGCATGQEAYSIAMLIHHEREKLGIDFAIKIFATDVHPDAIRFAQRGIFPDSSLAEIPIEFRDKYLVQLDEGFEIESTIRNSIVFARHDVLQDAPFTNMDLISCRNLLIYLVDDAQSRVLNMFTHAMRSRGVLWLGPSETPGDLDDDFAVLDKQWRIFQKERETRLPLDLRLRKRPPTNASLSLRTRSSRAPSAALISSYDRLLEQYAPAGILIDDSMRPLQIFGDVSRFTKTRAGRLNGTIDDLLIESLRLPVAVTVQRLRFQQAAMMTESGVVDGERVTVSVRSMHHPTQSETHYFISFTEESRQLPAAVQTIRPVANLPAEGDPTPEANGEGKIDSAAFQRSTLSEERIRMLEMDLDFTRENLQATIEEVETTNEELQSSNEELTSSNEELQSTNEELHSLNEELHTTNAESSRRLQLLTEMTRDLENVMRESDIGIVLIDGELNIRRVTPAAADILLIRRNEVDGEKLSDYARAFEGINLVEMIRRVETENRPVECEAVDRRNDPILVRAAPYREREGFILTMTNLKSVRETADKLRKLTSIVQDSTDAIIGVDLKSTITSWNRGASRLFNVDLDLDAQVSHQMQLSDVLPEDVSDVCEALLRELLRKGVTGERELNTKVGDRQLTLQIRATPILDDYERVSGAAITLYDITKMRMAEEQLRLRTRAIDAASNGFLIVDAQRDDMPIVYANQGFETLTGYRLEDITGRNCRFLQGPITDPADVQKIRDAIANQESCRVTILNYRRNGEPFYNDLIVTPVCDVNDRVTHFVGIQSDVTEVVEANIALRNSEIEYRTTFENAAIGIAHVGLDGEWIHANEKLCQILGRPLEELKSKTFQDITHPDDLQKDMHLFAQMKRGDIPGYTLEKRYIRADGETVWTNLTTSLRRDVEGKLECCISLVEDITERKLTEQKLAASRAIITEVIEQSHDPFISFDKEGVIQFANHAARQLSGVERDLVGMQYSELFSNHAEAPLVAALARVHLSQKGETTEYYSRELQRWYDARVFPVDDGAAVYMTDVTGRKETEAYLEAARIAAEEASQAKSNFLTNMSHEIRSPMSAILGFADLSLRDLREGKPVDAMHLETVIRNGRFLLRIINDILDLSKVEAGKLDVRRSRFKLVPMLADINELMRHRSESSGVPLHFEFVAEIPQRLRSDRSRVEQILVNLIGNALKFTPQGSVRVVTEMDQDDPTTVCFRVIDTGIGISPANVERLFQTFTQVHDRKIVGMEGTGLGLVISQRLANLLGGNITVTSVEGRGSEFTLSLPVDESEEMVRPTEADLRPRRAGGMNLDRINARILVADDARDIRLVTTRFLARAGADVSEVVNGAEAIKAVRDAEREGRPFACVLMDMQMPELDGRQATQQIRNHGITIPIIALTAGATSEEINDALASGCTEFVAKPVDAVDLVSRVAKLTGG